VTTGKGTITSRIGVAAGFPCALNALKVIDQVLTEAGAPKPPPLRPVRLADHETLVARSGEAGPDRPG